MKQVLHGLIVVILSATSTPVVGQITLTRIDGSSFQAESAQLEAGKLTLPDRELDFNELRLIDFGKESRSSQAPAQVRLAGGGRLGATSVRLANEKVTLANVAGEISLGVEAVRSIRFRSEELPLYASAVPKEDQDQLFVKIEGNYQTVPGIVSNIDESKVSFLYDGDAIEFNLADVYGLIMAAGFTEETEINGVVVLTEGSRLNGDLQNFNDEYVMATVGGIAEVTIPLKVVSRIEIRSNRLAFLSDLEPESVTYQEGSVFVRPWRSDLNITGGELVLRDREKRTSRTFSKGLGTKSGMKLVYRNEGFDRFVATLGIDAATQGSGICQVKILGDGQELYSAELSGLDPPRPIDLEITDVNQLELVIEFGKDFLDLSDHVNWCDARFVKSSN